MLGVADLFADGAGDFTFREIAVRTRIAERTIYRHFPAKDLLLAEFWRWLNEEHLALPPPPGDAVTLIAQVAPVFAAFEAAAPLIRAMLADPQALRLRLAEAPARMEQLQTCLAAVIAPLAEGEAGQLLATVRVVTSASGWDMFRRHCDLAPDEAAGAAEAALRALFAAAGTKL